MDDHIINVVFICIVSWTSIFVLIRRIFPKRSFGFCNRIVSVIHASLAVTMASISVEDWRCPFSPSASESSTFQMEVIAVSLGYMVYDLVCNCFDRRVNMDNLIHHSVSIVGFFAGLSYQRCGTEMVAAIWITEISSPFLHLRELLKELGYRDTDFNLAADILFAATFTVARMGVAPFLAYETLSGNNPLLIKAMALGLQLVSVFWFWKIAKMVRYKLGKRSGSSTSKKCL